MLTNNGMADKKIVICTKSKIASILTFYAILDFNQKTNLYFHKKGEIKTTRKH